MSDRNVTFVKDFFIVGFPGLHPKYYVFISAIMLLVYVFTLIGNGIFLLLFTTNRNLHKPMYFIYTSLVLSDVLFSTCTLPKIIARYLFQDGNISFGACFLQMYLVHYFGAVNSYVLALMAIDRYIAVCYPFRYHTFMSNRNIVVSSMVIWIFAHLSIIMMVVRAYPLPYCGSNTILHCYCDHVSITRLACTDRTPYSVPAFVYAMVILLGSFAIILFSYFFIILAVLKISSEQGKLKVFSTCSSQLIIIALFFLPRCFYYLAANIGITFNADLQIAIIMLYSLLPPMINPVLYSLKTEEVKKILIRKLKKKAKLDRFLCISRKLSTLSGCVWLAWERSMLSRFSREPTAQIVLACLYERSTPGGHSLRRVPLLLVVLAC
ncbi:olfactory receptor 2AT4-like [Silurus meridionalis]|uniref:olfactory receptor 2AT4-like n=1 Tax=Silurus meridionalis TaxID=175797 RepID=UPI001EEC2040|nr:olfactory receptor 2AT4-like [Silurus meridionalis]